jgi:hypothetical protein
VDEREQLERDGAALRGYLHARIDPIEVGDLVTYLARPRRRHRLVEVARLSFAVAATALLLIAALIVGTQFRLARVTPAASPIASPAPVGLSSKYGVIALTREGFVVRSETDPNPIRRIEPTSHRYAETVAVSHSGRLVAYWRPPNSGELGDVLMLYDAATNADPRPLVEVPNEFGGSLVWADDDGGIAFASDLHHSPFPAAMRIQTVEIVNGVAKGPARLLLFQRDSDQVRLVRPLAWIRETRTVSAVEGTIEGVAKNYLMVGEDGSVKRFAVSSGDQVVRLDDVIADDQTRTLAYLVTFGCQDGKPGCTLVRFWTLEDPQQALGWQAIPGTAFVQLLWQPFTRNLLVVTRSDRYPSLTLQVWSSPHFGSSRSIPLSQADAPSLLLMRPDGRAIFVGGFDGAWRADLIALDGNASSVAADLTPTGGGAPALSVTLDPSEAERIDALAPTAPLLAQSEVEAQVRKTVGFPDHIDQLTATFDRGSYPLAGRVPTWTVKATGEFRQILRGVFASTPPPAHCAIWTFNARTGIATGSQATEAIGDCS